jgi:thioesterase domain-containing protein/acyl carrier protein
VPIGVPIGEARIVVLDASGEPVAAGVPGELWIGGGGVAVGYLNDEAMTLERFVPDPFATDPRARLYRSGDRARWLPSGELEFLGRADSQVKIRGFRIEPAEIEFAMLEHPAVRHAAVVVRPSTSAGHELDLIGYVELRDARLNEATLRDFLSVKLPSYAIPARLVLLETLPKTASDKIDRNALPVPPSRTMSAQEIAPALDELHQQLIRLWERLLGTTPIGIRDNFFALGGNSLLAARLIGQIEREFQARLPLAVLFEHPTVEALALALRRDPANLNRSPLVVLNPEGSAPPLFFLHGSITGGGYYCLALAKHVGNDRPIFAMRPHGVDGGDVPGSIAEAAATNIDALIAKQPQGPYILGGFSSAALVAYEMALQLTQRGHVVDNVVLIDAPYAGPVLRAGVAIVERCGPRLGISATRRNAISALLWRLAHNLDRLRVVNDKRTFSRERLARLRGAFAREPVNGEPAESSELGNQWLRITAAYRLRPYSGRLTLLFSAEATPRTIRAWSIAAPRVDRRSIPGTHFTCITDHIAETAHALAAAL